MYVCHGQSIYAETFGNSVGFYTLNYEGMLTESANKVVLFHAGIGIYNVSDKYLYKSFPLGISTFNRKQGNHHREIGICVNYVEGFGDNRATWIGEEVQYSKVIVLLLNAGYRYEKPDGHFIFKLYWSPTIRVKEFASPPYNYVRQTLYLQAAGLGLGYKF
jgi:hypothetical protein